MQPPSITALAPLVAVSSLLCACATKPPPAPEPAAPPLASAAASEPSEQPADKPPAATPLALPTACAEDQADAKLCLPPAAFVKRLCEAPHPDIALALLAKGTPFTRGYVTRDVEAWYASGGISAADKLHRNEEVLLLLHRVPDTGGMVVSGSGGGYDVLRWDGSCASLMSEEVRLRFYGTPKYATISWRTLTPQTRNALEADKKVATAIEKRREECKGATMGEVSGKCAKADKKMSAAIVKYVRSGGDLPPPLPLP